MHEIIQFAPWSWVITEYYNIFMWLNRRSIPSINCRHSFNFLHTSIPSFHHAQTFLLAREHLCRMCLYRYHGWSMNISGNLWHHIYLSRATCAEWLVKLAASGIHCDAISVMQKTHILPKRACRFQKHECRLRELACRVQFHQLLQPFWEINAVNVDDHFSKFGGMDLFKNTSSLVQKKHA